MSPEEMLAENLPTESPEPTPAPTPEPTRNPGDGGDTYVPLGEEQVQDILSQVTFDLNHYKQLYTALHDYGNEPRACRTVLDPRFETVLRIPWPAPYRIAQLLQRH